MWHRLYYLVTWTTRDRSRLIDAGLATFLCPYFRCVARQERAHALEIGMVTTHVHALVRTHPTTDLTRLVQRLKGGSSALAGKGNYSTTGVRLKWAKGYSITTLGARALMAAREYLRTQPAPHPAEAIVGWKGDGRDVGNGVRPFTGSAEPRVHPRTSGGGQWSVDEQLTCYSRLKCYSRLMLC